MKLSMITVCYNAEKQIKHTIESVLSQTIPIFEYIIVDGGSQDATVNIVKSYKIKFEKKNINFKYISEIDYGISDAFNKGIRMAAGDLIGLINADDEMMPDAHAILKKIYEVSDADIYYGNCIWIDNANKLSYILKPKERNENRLNRLLYEMVLVHPATYIKKQVYDQYGYYDVLFKYCMDQELLYRMYKQGAKFLYIDKELAKMMAGGISDNNSKKVFREASRIALAYKEPVLKVKIIELKKNARDSLSRLAKKVGLYRMIKAI